MSEQTPLSPQSAICNPQSTIRNPQSKNPHSALLFRLALLAFITGFSGALMPGPFLMAVIDKTSVQGMRGALGLLSGHAVLELIVVTLLALGLSPLLARRRVRATIGLVGGAALLYMGCDMLWHAWGLTLNLSQGAAARDSFPALMLWGALICLANPYFTGWWATVGAGQLAHMAPRTPLEYGAFFIGHQAADYSWYCLVAVMLITSRRWFTDGVYRGLILGCGLLLLAIAVKFLLTGWRMLREGN